MAADPTHPPLGAVRRAAAADVIDLAPRLRPADVAELWAAHRATPRAALADSLAVSAWAGAGVIGGRVECLFGVAPAAALSPAADPRIGIVWLLGSDRMAQSPFTVLRQSRAVVAGWQREYAVLTNWVDARNGVSLRWLRWLGFQVEPARPFGPDGLPFHRVYRQRRTECVQYQV